ncbi:MAG: DUF3786 domain-containing protein [Deltaproteobacteria bacterium]|nr:DUF3786 domain-containing protein [Deltaproteobacteria bacterium]
MADCKGDIATDPEANVLYEKCSDVDAYFWQDLLARPYEEVTGRTGASFINGTYQLPFLNRRLVIAPAQHRASYIGEEDRDPGFQLCLVALLFLLRVNPAALPGSQVSPREFKGGTTFFQGPHALPVTGLEERFGRDATGFLRVGQQLGGQSQDLGDAALTLPVFPGLSVGVILWEADDEFPAQVSLTVPAGLDQYWPLDAVWALLNVVTRELWCAGLSTFSP